MSGSMVNCPYCDAQIDPDDLHFPKECDICGAEKSEMTTECPACGKDVVVFWEKTYYSVCPEDLP